jgi:hypothetical protein
VKSACRNGYEKNRSHQKNIVLDRSRLHGVLDDLSVLLDGKFRAEK